jgi:hypothetical protein
MGHLTFIADEVSKLMDNYSEVEATVRDDVDLQRWDNFYIEVLAETRERDTLPLGGDRPSAGVAYSASEEEDDEDALVGTQEDVSWNLYVVFCEMMSYFFLQCSLLGTCVKERLDLRRMTMILAIAAIIGWRKVHWRLNVFANI